MQFVAQDDIGVPINFVFEQFSDFAALERAALRRGADVQRTDRLGVIGPGMTWTAGYEFRRMRINMELELTQFDEPDRMFLQGYSPTLNGTIALDLVALSRARTRIKVSVDARARTLPARLFLQSLKFARAHPEATLNEMVSSYAERIELRYLEQTKKGIA